MKNTARDDHWGLQLLILIISRTEIRVSDDTCPGPCSRATKKGRLVRLFIPVPGLPPIAMTEQDGIPTQGPGEGKLHHSCHSCAAGRFRYHVGLNCWTAENRVPIWGSQGNESQGKVKKGKRKKKKEVKKKIPFFKASKFKQANVDKEDVKFSTLPL